MYAMRYEQGWSPCLCVTVPMSFKWCSTCATQQKMSLKSVSLTPEVCWLHSKWEESCRFSSLFRGIYWLSSTDIGGGLKKNELGLTSIIIYWLRLQLCCKSKERGTLIVSYSFAYLSLCTFMYRLCVLHLGDIHKDNLLYQHSNTLTI